MRRLWVLSLTLLEALGLVVPCAGSQAMGPGLGSLSSLPRLGGPPPLRASSADASGKNADYVPIAPGETKTIFDEPGPGCIRHLWVTLKSRPTKLFNIPDQHLRWIVIRMFWDGEQHPSVEAPIGDFFGLGHAEYYSYESAVMSAAVRRGLNCYLPMPFYKRARIEVQNQSDQLGLKEGGVEVQKFYYNIDYERYTEPLPPDYGLLHAQWRRQNPTPAVKGTDEKGRFSDNYVILDAKGKGRYVGCNLSVHSLNPNEWWGEGDEMMAIDSAEPNVLGTGTEDYFCCAWGFPEAFSSPYYGVPYLDSEEQTEKTTAYRWHIEDPVMFAQSIIVSIEHGAGNHRADDFSSTAYWYQTEPHVPFATLPAVKDRLPLARKTPMPAPKTGPSPKVAAQPAGPQRAELDEADMARVAAAARAQVLWCVWVPVGLAVGAVALNRWARRRGRSSSGGQ